MRAQRGVALLVVLWVLAVLSTLLAVVAATVQLQLRQARWQAGHVQALLAAEAGLSQAIMGLQARDPKARWLADGRPHGLVFADATLAVSVRSERGKLDLNAAPLGDVRRVLLAGGAPEQSAQAVISSLEVRRNGPTPLRTLEEFRQLDGMTFALYRRLVPVVTLWSGQPEPDPALAPPALAEALGLAMARAPGIDSGQIFTVDSEAQLPTGDHATLQVTLMLTSVKEGARPYRVLRWQE